MRFEDLAWIDVEHYLENHDDRVIVTTGACEQHGYLSLLTDIRAPLAIADAAARVEHVLIAPPLNFGVSPYFMAYPGTISLSEATFKVVVRETLDGLIAHGFRRLLINNGHGGNTTPLKALLDELRAAYPDASFGLYEWWRHEKVQAVAQQAGLYPTHANWLEALPVCRVGELPAGSKPVVDLARLETPEEYRAALQDGSFGGAWDADPLVIDTLFTAAVEALVDTLRGL